MPSLGAACWNWSTVWPLAIKQISAPDTRFQGSVVQVEGGASSSPMEVSKAIWCSPALCPGLMALLCLPSWAPFSSMTLRTLSGGFAGTLSLFPLSCGKPSTVARMAETSLSSWRSASRGLGKSSLPRPHLPPSFCPWTRCSGPRGPTSVWFPFLLHCVRFFCKSLYSYFF